QAAGAVPKPVVRPGERVEKGQVIAEVPAGSLGVPLHASISGVVRKISPEMVIEKVGKE
ncbi:MAG: biotin/lipoyl-containing protein, partial [Desulfotomaculales bacterium]